MDVMAAVMNKNIERVLIDKIAEYYPEARIINIKTNYCKDLIFMYVGNLKRMPPYKILNPGEEAYFLFDVFPPYTSLDLKKKTAAYNILRSIGLS